MCWELQLRVQQCRAYIKCPRCQGEWQRWLKARQELLSAPGRVTALLITKSILLTSDMGIQSLCFGEFYLFWPREGRWAAPLGASLLLWELDKLIQAGSSGGWNFLHPLSFLCLFFPPAGLYCRKDKKKSIGIAKKRLFWSCALDVLTICEVIPWGAGSHGSLWFCAYNCAPICAEKGLHSPRFLLPPQKNPSKAKSGDLVVSQFD